MLLLRFIHSENKLYVGDKIYLATCKVRNEINEWRKKDQVVKTYPINGDSRKPYYPRKFPTGLWRVKKPIWTDDIDYSPVKIPTDAFRGVLIWDTDRNGYSKITDKHQTDSFYHLHFAKMSSTTLGCIRLDSDKDAIEIAENIELHLKNNQECWIEVLASKE